MELPTKKPRLCFFTFNFIYESCSSGFSAEPHTRSRFISVETKKLVLLCLSSASYPPELLLSVISLSRTLQRNSNDLYHGNLVWSRSVFFDIHGCMCQSSLPSGLIFLPYLCREDKLINFVREIKTHHLQN